MWRLRGSNAGPWHLQCHALPTELRRHSEAKWLAAVDGGQLKLADIIWAGLRLNPRACGTPLCSASKYLWAAACLPMIALQAQLRLRQPLVHCLSQAASATAKRHSCPKCGVRPQAPQAVLPLKPAGTSETSWSSSISHCIEMKHAVLGCIRRELRVWWRGSGVRFSGGIDPGECRVDLPRAPGTPPTSAMRSQARRSQGLDAAQPLLCS